MTSYLKTHHSVGTAYFAFNIIDSQGQVIAAAQSPFRCLPKKFGWQIIPPSSSNTPLVSLIAHHHAFPSVTIFRREVFELTNGWDEDFKNAFEDQDIVWQAATVSSVHYVPIPVAQKREHEHNVSKQSFSIGYKQLTTKWWQGKHLSRAMRRNVRDAMVAEALMTAYLNFHGARKSLQQNGSIRQALILGCGGFKKLLLYAIRLTSNRANLQDS
jgi:hypothetical protein